MNDSLNSDFPFLKESFLKEQEGKYGKYYILSIPVSEDMSKDGFVRLMLDADLVHNRGNSPLDTFCALMPSKVDGCSLEGYYDLHYPKNRESHGIVASCDTGANSSNCIIDSDKLIESYKSTDYYKKNNGYD